MVCRVVIVPLHSMKANKAADVLIEQNAGQELSGR